MIDQTSKEFWRGNLARTLPTLRHAEVMYARQKTDASRDVIWEAIYSLRKEAWVAIQQMGGMAGEW